MTSVGRFTRAMHWAMVKVLPEPVTPSKTCDLSPRFNPSTSSSIARDWSPRSVKSVTRLKRSYFDAIEQKIVPHREAGGGRSEVGTAGSLVTLGVQLPATIDATSSAKLAASIPETDLRPPTSDLYRVAL